MVLMFPTHSIALETMSNIIRCSDSMTCTKCTLTPECVWSLMQQECGHKNQFNSSSLIIPTISECPQISVVTSYRYNDFKTRIHVTNNLKITNDLVGFTYYLLRTKMYYVLQNTIEKEVSIYDKTLIWFPLQKEKATFDVEMPTVTYFMFIKFNSIMLRFDKVEDHYFTFYKHEECATNEANKYKSCATCGWNKNGNSNYLKWCSSENTCEVNKNLYMKNNATHQLNENVAFVTNDCAEINVTAVDPLSGPQTGGTTLTIIVKNHRIFAENRTLKVTVAGTLCTNLKTSGLETITCTTSQVVGALSGPVLVEYSSLESGLKIESSQIFHFCPNPVLDEDQQLGGVVSGGTSVPVRGSHFVEPCVVSSARLYVDLVDGVRRYAESYCDPPINDTYMVCRTPRVNGTSWNGNSSVVGRLLNFGLEITFLKEDLSFNHSLPIAVRSSSPRFYVHPDPVFLDFEIDVSGSVVVNGLNLENFQPEDIVIQSADSPSSLCEVVTVTRHSWVCEPTMSVNGSQVVSVTLANSSVFTVIRRTSHHPDDPYIPLGWFLVIIFTVLAFFCAFAFFLTRKYRYATKNICKPPKAYIRSRSYTTM
ncbi:unnamed protein product [Macrosiphum euphorbiae]|nr:unnamed protein product [Macrosiphum euphorbiae]